METITPANWKVRVPGVMETITPANWKVRVPGVMEKTLHALNCGGKFCHNKINSNRQ